MWCSGGERIEEVMGQDVRRQNNKATRIDKTRRDKTREESKGHKEKRSKTDRQTEKSRGVGETEGLKMIEAGQDRTGQDRTGGSQDTEDTCTHEDKGT